MKNKLMDVLCRLPYVWSYYVSNDEGYYARILYVWIPFRHRKYDLWIIRQ